MGCYGVVRGLYKVAREGFLGGCHLPWGNSRVYRGWYLGCSKVASEEGC